MRLRDRRVFTWKPGVAQRFFDVGDLGRVSHTRHRIYFSVRKTGGSGWYVKMRRLP